MSKRIYDVVLFGLNIENLLLADQLNEKGRSFLILEEGDEPKESPFENRLDSFFYEESSTNTIESNANKRRFLTFEGGKLKDFIGFGKKKQSFDFDIYLKDAQFEWQQDLDSHLNRYIETYREQILFQSKITKINRSEENEKNVSSIEINDQKNIKAHCFLWTQNLALAADLLGADTFGAKNTQKLAKSTFWTRVDLHLLHSDGFEADTDSRYILMAGTEDAKPVLGTFYFNPEQRLCSQWGAFIESALCDSGEEMGNLLREAKRQIKRAFSGIFEAVEFEKIQIISDIYNDFDLALDDQSKIRSLNNFFGYNHNFHRFVHKKDSIEAIDSLVNHIEFFLENNRYTDAETK